MDDYIMNPAAAGFGQTLVAHGMFRNQWNGLQGGASSQAAFAHLPMYILNGGLGLGFRRDAAGATISNDIDFSYNYVLSTPYGFVSAAAQVGWSQLTIDGSVLRTADGVYNTGIDHKDDNLPVASSRGGTGHVGIGVYWTYSNWSAGATISRLGFSEVALSNNDFKYALNRTWGAHAGYSWTLFGYDWKTSAWINHNGVELQSQISLLLLLPNNIHAGVAFRGYTETSADAVVMSFGVRLNEHFRLTYAYDYLVSRLNQASTNNTHEFALTYKLGRPIRTGLPPRIIYNPRY